LLEMKKVAVIHRRGRKRRSFGCSVRRKKVTEGEERRKEIVLISKKVNNKNFDFIP